MWFFQESRETTAKAEETTTAAGGGWRQILLMKHLHILKLFLTNKNIVDGSYAEDNDRAGNQYRIGDHPGSDKELDNKLNILLASGDRPDIIQCETETMESQLLSAGILLPINEYWDNYPNIKNGRDEATWDLMRYTDGNILFNRYQNPNPLSIIAYRQDWLDKLGLEVPTTLDESIIK